MNTSQRTSIVRLIILFCIVFTVGQAAAAEVRTGERVYISPDTVITEDLYAAAREVLIDGVIHGDVVAAGSTVTIHGQVDGSVMAAGGTVIIDGKIGRAVRLGGGAVHVNSAVGSDVIAVCGTCAVSSAAKVGADLYAAGGDLDLAGPVARGLRAAGAKVRLAGTTERDAQVRAGSLRIEASAATPSLLYGAREVSGLSADTRIGRVENHPEWAPTKPNRFAGSLVGALMALVTGAVFLRLLSGRATSASQLLAQRPFTALLYGLAVATFAPVLIVMGMITVLAVPLSMLAAAVYLGAIYLGYLSSAHFLGERILSKTSWPASPFAALTLGILTLSLTSLLPVVGPLVSVLATLAGLGSLWLLIAQSGVFSTSLRQSGARGSESMATPESH